MILGLVCILVEERKVGGGGGGGGGGMVKIEISYFCSYCVLLFFFGRKFF